ncbi:MAG: GntR family transcriptional regulator [Sphaerochaetaceae bacterium]
MFKKHTITDYIYEQLLDDIISLHYPPGEKLSEAQLAQRFEVSRDPVRKALIRLERENFVQIKPQFGTIVSEISIEKGKEICDVRMLLETYAAKIAAEKVTTQQLNALQHAFNKLETMDKNSDSYSKYISEIDILLHNTIYEACGNGIIREVNMRYSLQIQRIRRANITWVNRLEPTKVEMLKIFEALKKRDSLEAENSMREHIGNIKAAIEKLHQ